MKVDFKTHVGDPEAEDCEIGTFEDIPEDSIIDNEK